MNYLNVEKAFICGYSTGGSVALEFLLTAPERALGSILIGGISELLDWRLKNSITLGITLAKMDPNEFTES
jgi:pimeloyl-ACP methyl ester carboxylesterase